MNPREDHLNVAIHRILMYPSAYSCPTTFFFRLALTGASESQGSFGKTSKKFILPDDRVWNLVYSSKEGLIIPSKGNLLLA